MSNYRIGDEVYIHGIIDEIRKDTIIIKNEGGYFGTVSEEIMPSAQPEEIDSESCNELKKKCEELKAHIEYLRRQNDSMKGEMKALIFAVRCCGVSGNEVQYESD